MLKYLSVIFFFLILSCDNYPPADGLNFRYGNDCLPQAIVMTEALREKKIEATVLILQTNENWNHALCIYNYPPGMLWAWDADWKSIRLNAWKVSPHSVGRAWLKITHPQTILKTAEYLE